MNKIDSFDEKAIPSVEHALLHRTAPAVSVGLCRSIPIQNRNRPLETRYGPLPTGLRVVPVQAENLPFISFLFNSLKFMIFVLDLFSLTIRSGKSSTLDLSGLSKRKNSR